METIMRPTWTVHTLLFATLAASALLAAPECAAAETYFVSSMANNSGAGTRGNPLPSIQEALDRAMPGDTIRLMPGRYFQDFKTVRDGRLGNPIVIEGQKNAIVSGAGEPRIVQINHDYIELRNFTVDGKHSTSDSEDAYRDKLIYAVGAHSGDGVTGVRIIGMKLKNAGGECIRFRYQARRNEVAHSTIQNCGVYDFVFDGGGKNGEGIYIGTAPEQLGKNGVPDSAIDRSDGNWIHHNTFDTRGNECVDIKEGSSGNIVEHNRCTGQKDKDSAGLDARGNGNIFRHNIVYRNRGAGIRLGGDTAQDGIQNSAYANTLRDNAVGSLKVMTNPQGKICGNIVAGRKTETTGRFGQIIDPRQPC
ncbi:nitrous oxide reductase family maturation protein NosD [Microvirga sp. 2YAF29]|uniref:right-handed parallel beta-helix repeat-containing protein n=1 Tax=Microvirga sp. 2YAF29 TaxID=3233031 RepID=UPI003F96327C